ncbi:MAG: tetratricopeptide repeat protein [Rickettsiales bacterium]
MPTLRTLANWQLQSAKQGNEKAQINLGFAYYKGNGVEKNIPEAIKWLKIPAERGNANIQLYLGTIYSDGGGVAQDHKSASDWYRKSAERGNTLAQYFLSLNYANGKGVPKDYELAYMWANIAAAQNDQKAIELRATLEKTMTPKQIAEGQSLSRNWKPKKEAE